MPSVVAELHIGNRRDDFRKEGTGCRIFFFFKTLTKSINKNFVNMTRYDSHLEDLSQRAESRISASLMLLLELEYIKRLQCMGWNSVAVITSVNSSMLTGLISTMSR